MSKKTPDPNITFNTKQILATKKYDTKANMTKFLNSYVKSIRIFVKEAIINIWPNIQYDISKIIIKFKNETVLIRDIKNNNIYLCYGYDDISLTKSNINSIKKFFKYLEQFKVIWQKHTDEITTILENGSSISNEIQKNDDNPQEFKDYTAKIIVS